MSTTKRKAPSKKAAAKPAKPRKTSARGQLTLGARSKAPAPEPDEDEDEDDLEDVDEDEQDEQDDEQDDEDVVEKPAAATKKARASAKKPAAAAKEAKPTKATKAEKEPAAPAPPKPAYDLKGPIPPEGAGLPKKVGALLGIGQQTLGIKSFRPGQAEAFAHLLEGENLLAVMPTGSGKSLLYQLTSMIVPGVTVVVSPLIALIKDQLDKMLAKGVAACKIDSTLTIKQRREVDAMLHAPGGKLLLTTPERMAMPEFRTFLREASAGVGVSRFVVDEAHCVSQWGHDFRPSYLSLRQAIEELGNPPVLATTATAPPHVRDDILFQLGIEGSTIVTTTFDRPNLVYEVIVFGDDDEKMKTLVTLLKKLPRPGIVYCATVKKVEELYEALTRWGVPVGKYHGRMNKGERDASQNEFMASSELVMIATNAFGLGVDKPNIRNVLHYHVPGSLEAYAQEAGRGGRDGKPARCVLLFSPDDVAIQEYFLSGTYPTKRQVRSVFDALTAFSAMAKDGHRLAEETPPNVANIALSSSVGQQRTRTVLSLLKDEGFVTENDGLFAVADPPPDLDVLMDRARQYEARRIMDRQRLDALLQYVKAPGCRNQVILEYLGEANAPLCGRCDNCMRSRDAALAASTEATRLGASLTRQLDDDGTHEVQKPKREIKARVVRIDQQQPTLPDAANGAAAPAAAAPAPAPKPATVLRRSGGAAAPTPPPAPAAPPRPTVLTRSKADRPGAPQPAVPARPEPAPPPPAAAAPAAVPTTKPNKQSRVEEEDDDFEDDDDLEDDDDDLEGEDGELVDEDDDDLDDDEDDDDDDDYEVIDKTAAELAEEGIEGPGEITVLARKRVPKQPKQRPQRPLDDTPNANAAEARRRRRRRRRKRRAMLPPKSAFTTPVLSTAAPIPEAQPRRQSGGGGPVIEYVRGPMRIAMAPVASANPNDAGVGRRRGGGGRDRRGGGRPWDRRGGGGGGGGFDRPRFDRAGGGGPNGPNPNQGEQRNFVPGGDPNNPNQEGRRRRRRRRRRRGGNGLPMQPGMQGAPNGPNGGPLGPPGAPEEPVSFFTSGPQQPVMLGPDGQPMRKRRRRRRRGRGGRHREWRGGDGSGPAQLGPGGGGDGGGSSPPGDFSAGGGDFGGSDFGDGDGGIGDE